MTLAALGLYFVQWRVRQTPEAWSAPFAAPDYDSAMSMLRNSSAACPLDAWRVIDGTGRQVASIHPGAALPCPVCKTSARVDASQQYSGEYLVTCSGCYDADCEGDPPRFVSRCKQAWGRTRDEAIAEWNTMILEATE